MTLGEKISKLIREKKITLRELADKIGVTEYSMAMFVKNERFPRITYLKNLSIALGVSLDYLCGDDEPEKESPLKPKKEGAKATIKIENTETFGWMAAVRGARNAFRSWDKSDSHMNGKTFVIGEDDLVLLKKLARAGADHGKFLRMIHVQADITMPVYFMQELATYKVGTTMNSTSLQHTGSKWDFTADDFTDDSVDGAYMATVINMLNTLRKTYKDTGDYRYFRLMRQLMPMGYNYTVTWDANYAVLRNIYHARKNHKLSEWKDFCCWIESLPYAKELIAGGKDAE